jgi:MinD-like ATPase involved in chromosome partitioning or flagellar assembly
VETITFYSYKGGVGRTLAIANVAIYLALLGQKVVAIDFDLEAPGLHYKLLPSYPSSEFHKLRGLVDYIDARLMNANQDQNVEDYVIKVPTPSRLSGEIWLMPAGAAPSTAYWEKLSRLDWHQFLYSDLAPGSVFFLELKEAIREKYKPDVLLIDSRTGITEISGVATTLLADKVICLLLNNRENLEGARVIVGALRQSLRPPGAAPIRVFPVVSRLPVGEHLDSEQRELDRIRNFLNESFDGKDADTLFDEVLVLHNDHSLVNAERILVGSDVTPDKSPLLRDYLRLFGKAVNPDVIVRNFTPIIESALSHLLETPDDAQKELENLAFSFNLAPAFRELLKVYRLRNIESDSTLKVAEMLWHFRDDSDLPLLMSVISKNFKEIPRRPGGDLNADFIEDVWRRCGASDSRVAIDLAESCDNFGQRTRAAAILEEAWPHSTDSDQMLAAYLTQLFRVRRLDDARALAVRNKERCLKFPPALVAWGRIEAAGPWEEKNNELVQPIYLKEIANVDPVLSLQLEPESEDKADWLAKATIVLDKTLNDQDATAVYRIGLLFRARGLWSEFSDVARQHTTPSDLERIQAAILDEVRYRMPAFWDRPRRR